MHSDIHHVLHATRAVELHTEAAKFDSGAADFQIPRMGLRSRIGWTLVEVGLRLTTRSTPPAAAFRTA
ncbi:hypothetical protein RI138_10950 [Streptomyces sp. C11-1]|uniref:Uncharacterized protein n=1 Tax=Streptomyces durocortorensis TaxID=2811104 RepID=A0ABY9VTR2_9ACTN|nr:hypothetical protein [Streptomyces durocortorensis]WNF27312.1 hypothetical protein RI138_10950 [Streptomyces durocortorensis]